ncbi:MAG TPA: hypothetical protein VN843_34040 [Anaerolineales bacterium]|nr:hypothetical protein [Anaerolineales bacterium]
MGVWLDVEVATIDGVLDVVKVYGGNGVLVDMFVVIAVLVLVELIVLFCVGISVIVGNEIVVDVGDGFAVCVSLGCKDSVGRLVGIAVTVAAVVTEDMFANPLVQVGMTEIVYESVAVGVLLGICMFGV